MAIPLRARLRFENPILSRELRTRMRGARAFWVLFVYLAVLSVILFVTYMSWWQSQRGSLGGGGGAFTIGKTFYGVLFTVQALLVGIITPALTAGGISVEKEQRTLELLSVSLLPRRSIVLGKLFAAVAFIALLLTSSLPLVSIGFLLGGVSPGEVLSAFGLLILTAFVYGAVGIACSSVAQNTTTATVMTYGTILLLFFATLPLTLMAAPGFFGAPGTSNLRGVGLTAVNPLGALTAGTLKESYYGVEVPAWLTALVINGLFATLLTLVAVHRMDYPRKDNSGLLRALTALFVGVCAVAVGGLFLPGNSGISAQTFVVIAFLLVLMLIVLLPLFVTSDGLPEPGGVLTLLDPRRLRRGEAPSGLAFVLLLVLLCGGILVGGAMLGPSNSSFLVPNVGGPVGTPPAARGGATVTTLVVGDVWNQIPRLVVLTLATTWFFGGLGLLFSALVPNRWSAMSLLACLMLIVYLIPFSIASSREAYTAPSPADNLVYLTPLAGAVDIGVPGDRWGVRGMNRTLLVGGATPIDRVSSGLFAVGGLAFLIAAHAVHRRRHRSRADATAPASPA